MNQVTKSIRIFGIYTVIMGLILLLIPNIVLPVFGLKTGDPEVWLRMLGFVLCCSGYYYIRSAGAGNVDFARYTVHTRFAAPVVVTVLIFTGIADWHLFSFGLVDGAGGLWTYMALKKIDKKKLSGVLINPGSPA
jgi:hypothetical protein